MPGFPKDTTFSPYLVLRNTTEKPLDVGLQLNYMMNTNGGAPVTRNLRAQHLAPFEARQVDMQAALNSAGLVVNCHPERSEGSASCFGGSINLSLSFTGKGGDLVLASGSVDQTGTYVFEVEPQGVGSSRSKYTNYWGVANGNDTMLSLFNPTNAAQDILATFYYGDGSGKYTLPVHLEPQASTLIDMAMLIAEHHPDADGNVIPSSVQEGSADFASAKGRREWITLVIAGGIYNVVTATCGSTCITCCGDSGPFFSCPSSVPVGQLGQCNSFSTDCNGYPIYPSSWSSSNTPVLTVNGGGVVTAVSPGQATATAYYYNLIATTGNVCGPSPSCPTYSPTPASTISVTPTITFSGPAYVPLRTGSSTGPNSNTYTATGNPSGGTYSWTASNGNVTLTNASSATVTVTAANASGQVGDTAITVTYTANSQSASSTANITVVKPSSLASPPTTDTVNSTGHTCSASATSNTCSQSIFAGSGSYSSYVRNRTYKILDQFNNWIAGYPLDIQESYTSPTGQCASDKVVTGSGNGDTVTDCFYFCSATCQQGGSCNVSATQTITVNGYSVRTESVTWTCSSATLSP